MITYEVRLGDLLPSARITDAGPLMATPSPNSLPTWIQGPLHTLSILIP